jgi:flavodoxin
MKYFTYAVCAVLLAALLSAVVHLCKVAVRNKKEMSAYAGQTVAVDKDFGKTLVVFYSLTGHTRDIAEKIRRMTNADLYEIETADALPKGAKLHLAVRDQIKTENYPELKNGLPDLSSYDTVFVGAPVWWYTVATPVLSYLKKTDFLGKKVVPFSTQGSNAGTFFADFAAKARNAVLLKGEQFNNLSDKYAKETDNKIAVWLNSL